MFAIHSDDKESSPKITFINFFRIYVGAFFVGPARGPISTDKYSVIAILQFLCDSVNQMVLLIGMVEVVLVMRIAVK